MMPGYEPVLTKHVASRTAYTLDFYLQRQRGYEGLRKALTLKPNDIIEQVKASGLRGRGGAGFPTGLKWQFVLKDTPKPKYICCNADESEPGTFKDHVLMERNPHLLIEGCAISCYAIGAKVAYIYIRGEFYHVQEILEAEIEKALQGRVSRQEHPRQRLRLRRLRPPRRRRLRSRRGDGAHRVARRQARAAAHQAAVPRGRGPLPVPDRRQQRRDALQRAAHRAERPGVVRGARSREERRAEALLHQRPREAARRLRSVDAHDAARADLRRAVRGGMLDDRPFKAIIPGGSSVPLLLDEQLDTPASFDHVAEGRLAARLGRPDRARRHGVHGVAGDEPAALLPPRVVRQVHAVPRGRRLAVQAAACASKRGEGQPKDLDLLFGVANNIVGKTLCAFGDAAATPVLTTMKLFRHEYEAHVREGRCTLPAEWRAKQPMFAERINEPRDTKATKDTKIHGFVPS